LRYIDPQNNLALVDKEKEKYWSPIDFYVGGAEHATRHLIYARFWHKFLYDIGAVSYDEPFTKLQHVGLIMAEDGKKMSKRWGNIINPDSVVENFGADAMRVYEMFMGPFNQACAWSANGLTGARKFLEKVYKLREKVTRDKVEDKVEDKKLKTLLNKTVKKVGEDISGFRFNTAVSALMILVNEMETREVVYKDDYEALLKILSPFAPYLSQELWQSFGYDNYILRQSWPSYDANFLQDDTVQLAVQINGKMRATIEVPFNVNESSALEAAKDNEVVKKWLEGVEIIKAIFVPGRLLNIVVK
jgi:leucyl-tRNA synthetase